MVNLIYTAFEMNFALHNCCSKYHSRAQNINPTNMHTRKSKQISTQALILRSVVVANTMIILYENMYTLL